MADTRTRLPLPEPDLEIGGKLLPYDRRHFHTPGMAAKLGYTEGLQQYWAEPKLHAYSDAENAAIRERINVLEDALRKLLMGEEADLTLEIYAAAAEHARAVLAARKAAP